MLYGVFFERGSALKLPYMWVIFVQCYIFGRKIFNKVNYLLYLQRFGNEIEIDNSLNININKTNYGILQGFGPGEHT